VERRALKKYREKMEERMPKSVNGLDRRRGGELFVKATDFVCLGCGGSECGCGWTATA
jgi:hypothetical protein